jgi:hypothetical protein
MAETRIKLLACSIGRSLSSLPAGGLQEWNMSWKSFNENNIDEDDDALPTY